MTKKAFKPLAWFAVIAQKARLKAQTYLMRRPHRSFKRTKTPRLKIGGKKLPNIWRQLRETGKTLRQEKWLLIKLGFLYMLLSYLFIGAVSQVDFLGLRDSTQQLLGGDVGAFGNAAALFASAVTGSLSIPLNDLQQFLVWFIAFIFWLAIVWALRMRFAGNAVKVRDALYNACAPMISTAVLLAVILAQLVPAAVSVFLFALLQTQGVLQGGVEVMMFSLGSALLFLLSAYWLSASLLGLVVVTLPGMYPWKALSAASELVIGQRWAIALRIGVLALIICLLWALILIPALLLDGWLQADWLPIVPVVVQILGALTLIYSSVYIYKLYRSLL